MFKPGKMVKKRTGYFAEGVPPSATGLVIKGPYLKILKISRKAQAETFVVDVLVSGQVIPEIPIAELEIV